MEETVMRHYYATGNLGSGTEAYAFETKKERDHFVSWEENYDNRSVLTAQKARKWYRIATLLVDGNTVSDGYGATTITI